VTITMKVTDMSEHNTHHGWIRRPGARLWIKVVEASSERECWSLLLRHDQHGDRLVTLSSRDLNPPAQKQHQDTQRALPGFSMETATT